MIKYILPILLLLAGCQEENDHKKYNNCFMLSVSDAIPVQFWLNGQPSFNEKIEPGIQRQCFHQLFNADDEIRVQVQDTFGKVISLKVYDADSVLLVTLPFVEVATGVYEVTLIPEDETITNQKIKLEIYTQTYEYTVDTWDAQAAATSTQWRAIAYSPSLDLFAAVSQSGTGNRVMTSPDGVTWTTRVSAADKSWRSICWSESLGLFVAVCDTDVMTSADGVTWGLEVASDNYNWQDVIWVEDESKFIAVASNGTNRAMTSPDGVTWTGVNIGIVRDWITVAWGGGLYVIISDVNKIATSPDGVVWTERTIPIAALEEIIYASDRFIAVGAEGVIYSFNGINWLVGEEAVDSDWESVTYSEDVVVAVSVDGDAMYSLDRGETWTELAPAEANQWRGVTANGDGLFVAVSLDGTNRAMTLEYSFVLGAEVLEAYSDYLSIKVSHSKTKLIQYSNETDYAGIIYDGITSTPDFMIRVNAKFFKQRNPEENESEDLSDGSIVKLLGTVKKQKQLQVELSPYYFHRKLQYILQHNSIYIDNLAWVKEENYEQEEIDEHSALLFGKVFLTQQNNTYVANPFS